MKTILQAITLMCLLFLGVTSCNNDDKSKWIDIPREPQQDEMKIFFNTTPQYSEALFYISGNCEINWGDGEESIIKDNKKNQEIRHHYKMKRTKNILLPLGRVKALNLSVISPLIAL